MLFLRNAFLETLPSLVPGNGAGGRTRLPVQPSDTRRQAHQQHSCARLVTSPGRLTSHIHTHTRARALSADDIYATPSDHTFLMIIQTCVQWLCQHLLFSGTFQGGTPSVPVRPSTGWMSDHRACIRCAREETVMCCGFELEEVVGKHRTEDRQPHEPI